MDDTELEFCKECGMEFPHGIEETCPLCGNEVEIEIEPVDELPPVVGTEINDSERCAVCKKWYDNSDWWFWDYWTQFDYPDWLSIDYVWCRDCILKGISKQYPEFAASGLEPDTYLIWKTGLEDGIDLGPKLFVIEMTNAIRRLPSSDWTQMVYWLDSDCEIDEAEKWVVLFDTFHEAMEWKDAGFSPDEAEEWLDWECSPIEARESEISGDGCPPYIDFKKLGFSLAEATFLTSNDFTVGYYEGADCDIETWIPSGLSISEIVQLRDEIREFEDEFEAIHESSQFRIKYEERTSDFWVSLPREFEQLKETGLQITALNLKKFWGLTSKEILKVIDSGGDIEVAAQVVRQGGSVSKLGIIERLIGLGTSSATASLLAKRGFLVKHLKEIENGGVLVTPTRISIILESDADIKVDEALSWLKIDAKIEDIKFWRQKNFSVQEVSKWMKEGFGPEMASRWRDSGVKSPSVAKRRRDAGLNP